MKEHAIVTEVFQSPGYSLRAILHPEELATIRSLITESWLERIAAVHPELVSEFESLGIENYHELSHLIDHSALWPKEQRLLNAIRSARFIQNCSLFQKFKEWFGDYYITDVENLGHEEFNWRLVRPHAGSDVGPLHADVWFYDVYGQNTPAGKELV
jgi:hypothetical protein